MPGEPLSTCFLHRPGAASTTLPTPKHGPRIGWDQRQKWPWVMDRSLCLPTASHSFSYPQGVFDHVFRYRVDTNRFVPSFFGAEKRRAPFRRRRNLLCQPRVFLPTPPTNFAPFIGAYQTPVLLPLLGPGSLAVFNANEGPLSILSLFESRYLLISSILSFPVKGRPRPDQASLLPFGTTCHPAKSFSLTLGDLLVSPIFPFSPNKLCC